MFLHLKSSIPKKIEKLGIKKQIEIVGVCKKAENIILKSLNINSKTRIGYIKYRDNILYIKVDNPYILNEIKLRELLIKDKMLDGGMKVVSIKYLN